MTGPSVEVILPWRDGDEHRRRAREWVTSRYLADLPTYRLNFAETPPGQASGGIEHYPGPWIKARATMPAIRASSADVVVVADADVWTDDLEPAAVAVADGRATWAIPHRGVHRLSEAGTAALFEGAAWRDQALDERAYLGIEGGGIVVAGRETLLSVPLDPRFEGWGQEDEAWGFALRCMYGPPWRGKGALVHLYHPPPPRLTRARGSIEGWQLRKRYAKARTDQSAMGAILTEAATWH